MALQPEGEHEEGPGLKIPAFDSDPAGVEGDELEEGVMGIVQAGSGECGDIGALQPAGDRRAESLFGAIFYGGGPKVGEGAAEDDFAFGVVDFEACGEGDEEGGQIDIEEGRAEFEAVGHGGAIDFDEDVSGHVVEEVHAHGVVDGVGVAVDGFGHAGGVKPEFSEGVVGEILCSLEPAFGDVAAVDERAIPVVSGEQFVAAVAGDDDLHVSSREPGDHVGGDIGGICEGFVVDVGHFLEERAELGVIIGEDVMGCTVHLGDGVGVGRFIEAGFAPPRSVGSASGKAEGEGLQAGTVLGEFGGERDDGGGIEAAGEEGADGDIGDELALHGLLHEMAKLLDGGVDVDVLRGGELPVALDEQFAVVELESMSGREGGNVLIDGLMGMDVEVLEEMGECVRIELGADEAAGEEGLELRGEEQAACSFVFEGCEIERFFAEAVACGEEGAGVLIPQGEGEHSGEAVVCGALGDGFTVAVVHGEEDFGIGGGAEGVIVKLTAELLIAVDFAVEGDGDVGVESGMHGLAAAGEIHDGEACVSEEGVVEGEGGVGVRAAVLECVDHTLEVRLEVRSVLNDNSGDSAHGGCFLSEV